MVEVGILGEEQKAVPHACGSDPGIHHPGPPAAGAGFRDDRGKHPRHLGIDRKRLEVTLDSAGGTETSCASCAIRSEKNPEVKLCESRYRNCRVVGQLCQGTPVFKANKSRCVEKAFQLSLIHI